MDNKEKLLEYQEEVSILRNKLFDKGFQTEKELKEFEKNNKNDFDRYYFLVNEIRALKLELMTPEEKIEYYRQKEIAKEKYKNS